MAHLPVEIRLRQSVVQGMRESPPRRPNRESPMSRPSWRGPLSNMRRRKGRLKEPTLNRVTDALFNMALCQKPVPDHLGTPAHV